MDELSLRIKRARGGRGIRETAAEIGISPATLSRIEAGKQPDLGTFRNLCVWLNIDPSTVLGIHTPSALPPDMPVQAHFRADKNPTPETANHLAKLILAIQGTAEKGL
jgi:transcriptional regulator with XRE-family HTH domain